MDVFKHNIYALLRIMRIILIKKSILISFILKTRLLFKILIVILTNIFLFYNNFTMVNLLYQLTKYGTSLNILLIIDSSI